LECVWGVGEGVAVGSEDGSGKCQLRFEGCVEIEVELLEFESPPVVFQVAGEGSFGCEGGLLSFDCEVGWVGVKCCVGREGDGGTKGKGGVENECARADASCREAAEGDFCGGCLDYVNIIATVFDMD